MRYRAEIDGLRALAVLPVILFHAGFQSFTGGFVGVDVFFVISGYLITSIIISEKEQGVFTLLGFYERRIRRILPALIVVVVSCVPFAILWLVPQDLTDFSQSVVAVSLFSSNILFYLKTGYFDSASELKPLLHTWSLAVEEQYYLLYPIFILSIWRWGKRAVVLILFALASLSLLLAQWGAVSEPVATFFLLPARGWELLIGALAAFSVSTWKGKQIKSRIVPEVLAIVGALLILYAVIVFNKHTPFPSFYGLIPTIGTVLIILFGTERTLVGKMLSCKLLVGIGLVSYSAYLWHHPLFAFARQRSIEEPSKVLLVALIAASFLLAYFSWRWVETPFRNRDCLRRNHVLMISGFCSCVLISVGCLGHFKNGFVEGVSPKEMRMFYYPSEHVRKLYREGVCYLTLKQNTFSDQCRAKSEVGSNDEMTGALLWGDSHAAALSIGLRKALSGITQYTASGCPPLKDVVISWSPHCAEVNSFVMKEIKRTKPPLIILHASWISYNNIDLGEGLAKTIRYIHAVTPSSRVVIIGVVPQWLPSLPKVMLLKGIYADKETYLETPMWHELIAIDTELGLAARNDSAEFVSALDCLCVNAKCQIVMASREGFVLTIWDNSHLTESGSVLLVNKLLVRLMRGPTQVG